MLLSAQEKKEEKRPVGVFVGAGTGMNFGFDGLVFEDRSTSHNGAGFATDFYLGGWMTRGLGLRAGYQGFGISDRYTDFGNRSYSYLHADLLFRPHRNIIPYIHGGYVHIVNAGWGGGLGLMTPIHVGKHVSIVPDIKANVYKSDVFGTLNSNIAMTLSATIGVSVRLGGRKRVVREPEVVPQVRVVHDTVEVKEIVKEEKVVRDTVEVKEIVKEEKVVRDTVYIPVKETVIQVLHPEEISALALFDSDKSVLRPEVFPSLDRIVAWFEKYPDTTAVIEGHTDSTATPAYNQGLSERRALAVYLYFIEHGISPSRLAWVGYGQTRPVDTNATPEGRQRNRRVEIHVK